MYKPNGLSILFHSVISLTDATSYDNYIFQDRPAAVETKCLIRGTSLNGY